MSEGAAVLADAREREIAAFGLAQNAVVEAGAGTGKTTLLVRRLAALLLGPQDAPAVEEVVALTFTEKAAGDVKIRLAKALADAAAFLEGAPQSDKARIFSEELVGAVEARFKRPRAEMARRCRQALADLDKAAVGTIHSFAARVLRLYPVEAGVDPDFTVDDSERLFDDLFESEWARWLDAELGENAPRKEAWLEILTRAPLESVEALARALCGEGAELFRAGRAQPGLARALHELAAELERAARGRPNPGGNSKIHESLAAVLARLKGMAMAAEKEDPPWPGAPEPDASEIATKDWPKKWDQAGAPLYALARGLAKESCGADEVLVRRAALLVMPFAESFRRAYARRGFVSFEGLLRRARDLVRDRLDVRSALKRRYRAFLIDEFQDTDPLQGEFLIFLAEETAGRARRWEETKLSPGRLFVVGDPKQSIYRFRGADMAAYQRFTAHILASSGAAECVLSVNFRSPAALLSPVNAVFPRVMAYEKDLQPEYKELVLRPPDPQAQAPSPAQEPALEFVVAEGGGGKLSADESRRAQFEWLSAHIAEGFGPGKARGFSDAAVLLRSSSSLLPLLDAFKARGIPYAVEMEKSFYGAPEIVDFLNVLAALDDPADKIALAGLLRSPLCALDDAELWRLAREGGLTYLRDLAPKVLSEDSRARARKFFAAMRSLRARVGRESLGALALRVLGELPFLELTSCAYHGEQSAANVLKFARLAQDASEGAGASLREFIDSARKEAKRPDREGESPLADEHLDAVRILTVHRAKGLEFPVVFLADVGVSPNKAGRRGEALLAGWSSEAVGLRLPKAACGAAMARLEISEKERQDKETVRLLYVAMTRAMARLVVLGGPKPGAGSLGEVLSEAGAWPGAEDSAMALGGLQIPVRRAKVSEQAPRPAAPRLWEESALDVEVLARIWREREALAALSALEPWTLSPTRVLGEADKRRRRAAAEDEEPGHGEDGPARSGAAAGAMVGRVCHRVLESWNFSAGAQFKDADLARAAERAAQELAGAEPEENWASAAWEAAGVLSGFLRSSAGLRLSRVEILGREIPFIYGQKGAVLRGVIDVLYREDGLLVVADFKSEKVSAKDAAARREKYAVQGQDYAAAIEKTMGE
ncbi:MAG: UvrD-helicase domain-containing protein, partial [Elusimicrobia bacterium]|nr:UvrD-helicase domain-containing protein [Elusimicrobiota bacterium]